MLALIIVCISAPINLFSQDKRALKAAEMSYEDALNQYKKGKFKDAAQNFDIVVSSIPASAPSRKHVEMRLESLMSLVEIYLYKTVNITQACEYLDAYFSTISTIKNSGVLKAADLQNYLKKEQEYKAKEAKQCKSYDGVSSDKDKFQKKSFESEFKE